MNPMAPPTPDRLRRLHQRATEVGDRAAMAILEARICAQCGVRDCLASTRAACMRGQSTVAS